MNLVKNDNEVLVKQISELLDNARKYVATTVNVALIEINWNIGKIISVDFEKHKNSENYKEYSIRNLSKRLTEKYGKVFSKSSLQRTLIFKEYYKSVPTLSGQLS